MQIILLDNIIGIGKKSDIVNVKKGYARNYLIPNNKCILATKDNINILKTQVKKLKLESLKDLEQAKLKAKKFTENIENIIIQVRTSNKGKLFGSISKIDIITALKKLNFSIDKKEISLPKKPIRFIGNYIIQFKFHEKIIVKKNINITSYKK
ncbi:50S ribosomal protein L9 [Enterobacteriaceae endosymbiont of Neohaemonia nigricornis]|uniref:50S ribosomal protein L9 n=1 Tax=Enterobacteriaceae endosymbiont of Neohaemonia nigricornis TaxID=2675792 RepID=UPI00144953B6|nr:50S ribosomal protein L9 [Enterobacteriaceae endosymbiont of Neohaemonia nigricornis]QJC30523.1 50S ribosomal protein L9 [Enterobacteriaceae endosymbiont of Neohaemonia nigricornis]